MGRKLVRFGVERVGEEGWTWSRHYCWASGAWPWATPQENQLHKQGSSEHVCTHTLFKSLPHIFLIHNTPRQTLLLKGKKLLCAELQVVRITAWLMWKDEQHMISTKVFRIKSGPTKVWVDLKKNTQDMTLHTENIIYALLLLQKASQHTFTGFQARKRKHTHPTTRSHATITAPCVNSVVLAQLSAAATVWESYSCLCFTFNQCEVWLERERDWMWWSNTPSANRNTRGEMDGEISAPSTVTFPTLSTLEGRAAQPTRRKA